MADHPTPHPDLGSYVLGTLTPDERSGFEQHLAGCADCRAQIDDLAPTAALLARAAAPFEVPAGLEQRTLAAVEREAASAPPRRALGRLVAVAGVAAALVIALVVGVQLGRRGVDGPLPGGSSPPRAQEGELEVETVLRDPRDPDSSAFVEVREVDIGRIIDFATDELPILPKGELYELWFAGPGDSRQTPNRISAGTFHPDEQGRSVLQLTAAVDPAKYPVISVTAEPKGGNPAWEGREVLRSDVAARP